MRYDTAASRWNWKERYVMRGEWEFRERYRLSMLSWGVAPWASNLTVSEMFDFRINLLRGEWKL